MSRRGEGKGGLRNKELKPGYLFVSRVVIYLTGGIENGGCTLLDFIDSNNFLCLIRRGEDI